jgi:methionyl-tRNA synthetase
MEKILITTPIYYVNDKPHIGHAYTTLAADVLTRFFRLQKKETFFLTGTDEHGAKIAETAKILGISPKELCDKNSELFQQAWKNLNINYDYFIRTTDEHHEEAVKKFVDKLKEKNAIYEKEYEGLYCTGCEKFLTEKELIDGLCPDHKTKPEKVSEKNYFFKLKNYLKEIENLIKNNKLKIGPENAKKETLGLFKQRLDDFSISRQKVEWGIDLPFDKNQTVYVWVDALLNYLTGDGSKRFKKHWKDGTIIHLLAKDILKFHAIYWPAMLLAVGEKTPDEEFIHGFFTINGQKMSKTLGNVIDPNDLVKKFGMDATRYLLLSQFPFGQDGDVQESRFVEKYNADLANGLGNLVARVLTLATKLKIISPRLTRLGRESQKLKVDNDIKKRTNNARENYEKLMGEFKLYEALEEIWKLIGFCDNYMEQEKPWKNPKPEKIINNLLYCISEIADLIVPFLPETSEKIKNQIKGSQTSKSGKTEILFPRI